jgi:ABC-type branched-subunit amino acid transport system ATPase component
VTVEGTQAVALEVENLEVTYSRVIVAVQGVSLKVPEGSIVALLGTNGAGKSTTVRAISGFLPVDDAEIRKGAIRFAGESILGLPPYAVANRGVVLVPERRKIFETLTVHENLRIARRKPVAAAPPSSSRCLDSSRSWRSAASRSRAISAGASGKCSRYRRRCSAGRSCCW